MVSVHQEVSSGLAVQFQVAVLLLKLRVIEGLTGAGGPVSIAGKVVMGAGGSP